MSSAGVFPADVVNVSCVLRPQVLDLSRPVTAMVQLGGFEPPTSGSTDRRSNHLSYSCTRPAWRGGRKLGAKPPLGKGFPALSCDRRRGVQQTKARATGPGYSRN